MAPHTYLFFGRSGSGKGTQAQLLVKELNARSKREVLYIETGQRFRDFIQNEDSYTRDLTRHVLDEGGLLPAFMPIWIWGSYLIENFTGKEHLVLDGLARRHDEADVLASTLAFYKRKEPTIIFINTSREWSKERLLGRGRPDDTELDIEKRLDWFDHDAVPAMEHLKDLPGYTFLNINGEQPIEEVHQEILTKLRL